jgi:hypothetical protein
MVKKIIMKKVSARIFRISVSNIVAAYRKIEKTAKEVVSFRRHTRVLIMKVFSPTFISYFIQRTHSLHQFLCID